ncbi:MAG: class I SAM-dependent methyltransferase [Bacilli bacterium]|nr:class I SAM-dependent methyltransferase [Bacilli bacterium]
MEKVLDFVRNIISKRIKESDVCVDATCGRGNDTLFLAKLAKKVYAFDIQKEAINSSKELLKEYENVVFINDSHENVNDYVTEEINVAMFNLGYLPKGDKNITTKSNTTISSIDKVIKKLEVKGIVSIVCYPGHPEGYRESMELLEYLRNINQKEYDIIRYDFINQINNPPFALIIERVK